MLIMMHCIFVKNLHFQTLLGGSRGSQKVYSVTVYGFDNGDNSERPLKCQMGSHFVAMKKKLCKYKTNKWDSLHEFIMNVPSIDTFIYFSPIGIVWLLEEVSSADYMAGFARQMPPLDSMIKRLKPNMVKDPFITDDASRISEMHALRYVNETCYNL